MIILSELSVFPYPFYCRCFRYQSAFDRQDLFVCVLQVYGQVSEIKVPQWRRKGLHKLRGGRKAHGSGTCLETYRIPNLFVGSSGLDAILSDRSSILRDLGLTSLRITDSLRNMNWVCREPRFLGLQANTVCKTQYCEWVGNSNCHIDSVFCNTDGE